MKWRVIIPRGVIVPHRNRMRGSGWFALCLLQRAGRPLCQLRARRPPPRSRARCPLCQLRRQDGGFPSQRRFPDSVGAAPIAGNNSKYTRKRHIKTKTMLSALYLDIQARRAVTFCRFSGTLFVSGNRQIVLLNLVFKCHSRWYGWHLNQLKAILNFLLRWRCL